MKSVLETLIGTLTDVLFPRTCPVCGCPSDRDGRLVCWNCFSSLPFNSMDKPHCVRCGKIPNGSVTADFLCDVCRKTDPAFDLARSALPYAGAVRMMIHNFKYNNGIWLKSDLVDALEGCVRSYFPVDEIDTVLPVPLHQSKLQRRHYNQAELLASDLAKRCGLDYDEKILIRSSKTPTQTHLGAAQRRKNVKGVFSVKEPGLVRSRTILVIDDVMTTGATLGEIAAVLKSAGAWRVWAAVIARGPQFVK